MPFAPYKNADELGIDKTRKFRVVYGYEMCGHRPCTGEIIVLKDNDNSFDPYFETESGEDVGSCFWSKLEYADEPQRKFKVGDKVKILDIPTNNIKLRGLIRTISSFDGHKIYLEGINDSFWTDVHDNFGLELINANNITPTGKNFMSVIKDAFRSVEAKALEYFGLGFKDNLSEDGRREFIDYIYETGDTNKEGFLKKIVAAYKEKTKK